MKFFKISTTLSILLLGTLLFYSCNDEKKTLNNTVVNDKMEMKNASDESMKHDHSDGHHNTTTSKEINSNESFQKNSTISPIIEAYTQIKKALASDDKNAAARGGTALLEAFSAFDLSKLSGETLKEYLEIQESAIEQAEHIVKSPIDHQREHFETLSIDINDLITLFGS